MKRHPEIHKVAFVADYPPRQCGIATFTRDLLRAVANQYHATECIAAPVDNQAEGYEYPPEVRFEFLEQDLDSYRRAADFLNFSNADVVCLQHEYGIFGGPAGGHVLALLRDLRMPVVTTLHTIKRDPTEDKRRVMEQLIELSTRLVVMSERGAAFLREVYGAPPDKIDLIPHGIPDMPFVDPNFYKDQFGVEGKHVALTFGLLAPNKGVEHSLRALPEVVGEFPDFVYIVLGATHPNLWREQGETYRLSLERLTKDLGVEKHVIFYNRFVDLHELTEFIGAADLYITPYLREDQITSGTLAYAFGCGKAVISTPYWHAEELLAEGRGQIVPFADSAAIAREIRGLLHDEPRRHAMRKRAYLLGREMIWSNVAHLYMESFQKARRAQLAPRRKPLAVRTQEELPHGLPGVRINHLARMTDSTGVLRHAMYSIPNYREGYHLEDNCRGLVLTVLLEELGHQTEETRRIATACAAMINYSFDPDTDSFRGLLGFDHRWIEQARSQQLLGWAIWSLGSCVGRAKRRHFQSWAVEIFERVLPASLAADHPRTWALALIGIHEYLRRLSGDRRANKARDELTHRLVQKHQQTADDSWPWFEDALGGGNARLPHSLILSGRWTGNQDALHIGLRSLGWLAEMQQSPDGEFRPLGGSGFSRTEPGRAAPVQPPLEASEMVAACIEAFRVTEDRTWLERAHAAFDWFMGRNDVGEPLYDSHTGGCCDGLHENRVNRNQGAEATLAFLLALVEMKLLENSLASFQHAADLYPPAAAKEAPQSEDA